MNFGKIKLYRKLAGLKMYLQPNFKKSIKVCYFDSTNFGDALNPIILNFLGLQNIVNVPSEFYKNEHLICIGSMLQVANKNSIIWGSGFISESAYFYYNAPKKILAVRGPKTKNKLKKMGVYCPNIFGDPALLLSGLYHPSKTKKYKIGIIPHYKNSNDQWINSIKLNPNVKIIDVMNPNTLEIIDQINKCEIILSSSLHGIIVADTYKIPAYWIKFTTMVGTDDFKFYDYFESVKRHSETPFYTQKSSLNYIINNLYKYSFEFNPSPLLNSFPFNINKEILNNFKTIKNIVE